MHRPARALVLVPALALAAFALTACGSSGGSSSAAKASSGAVAGGGAQFTQAPAGPPPSPTVTYAEDIAVVMVGSKVTPAPHKVQVKKGDNVRIVAMRNTDGEIHVHGYNIVKQAQAGSPVVITFVANQTGLFDVEAHKPDRLLLQLEVKLTQHVSPAGTRVVAHGIAVRQDLPIPFSYALVGAALALIVSFVALGLLWRRPRLEDHNGGLLVPRPITHFLDAPAFRWTLRLVGLAITALVVAAAVIGPDDDRNPTAHVVFVLFWIGVLVVLSALLGPIWRAINPLRTLHLLLVTATRADPEDGLLRYPKWLGCWPAAATLMSFAWLELVADDRSTVMVMGRFFALYAGIMLVGATLFGSHFFEQADGFERYSTTIGKLSPLGRRDDDRAAVLRNPLTTLTTMQRGIGVPAFVCVMLATTGFDAFSNSTNFVRWSQQGTLSPQVAGTIGLVGTTLVVFVAYGIASTLAGVLGHRPWHAMPAAFAHSLVPIALGYVVAHYYSFFLIGSQQGFSLLSDPFQHGSNYLGITNRDPSFAGVTPTTVAVVQVVAVVIGHVLGVVSAHDRAIALFPRKCAVLGQLPLLIVMVAFTITGLSLLFEF